MLARVNSLTSLVAASLILSSCGPSSSSADNDRCFVGPDLVACIDSREPGSLRVKTSTQEFVARLGIAVRYVHLQDGSNGFVVADDGRIGTIPWRHGNTVSEEMPLKFGGPPVQAETRVGKILAWTNDDYIQIALDDKGQLIITLPSRLSLSVIQIPEFPSSLRQPAIATHREQDDALLVIDVAGLVDGHIWHWTGTFS